MVKEVLAQVSQHCLLQRYSQSHDIWEDACWLHRSIPARRLGSCGKLFSWSCWEGCVESRLGDPPLDHAKVACPLAVMSVLVRATAVFFFFVFLSQIPHWHLSIHLLWHGICAFISSLRYIRWQSSFAVQLRLVLIFLPRASWLFWHSR